jgi:site-specific recombinase XerC
MRGAATGAIQALAGHADLTTTQRYMHLSPDAIDSAIGLLDRAGDKAARGGLGGADSTEIANS